MQYSKKFKTILVTGSHGFVGFHLIKRLIENNYKVICIDNLSSKSKKTQNLRKEILKKNKNIKIYNLDLNNIKKLNSIKSNIDIIIHLAAQPGVRYSLKNPNKTFQDNVLAFINILEYAKIKKIKNIMYASSSSVYGNTKKFLEKHNNPNNINSLYAASKHTCEIISSLYHKFYNLNFIGLRFFTVYGAYGREDMAYYKFLKQIKEKNVITIYGNKNSKRSFTHVDDITYSILKLTKFMQTKKNFNLQVNIGNPKSVSLRHLVNKIKQNYNSKFKEVYLKKNASDVNFTKSNNNLLYKIIGKFKFIDFDKGYSEFINWFKLLK